MKKIACDLCGSMDFVKENGMFICQGCGTKYTLEDAKSMMVEVEDNSADVPSAAASSVQGDNSVQQQISNLLFLAQSAFEADNCEDAEETD